MKILQIAVTLPYPPDDGGRQGIFNVTRFMGAAGAEVSMVAIDRPGNTVDAGELASLCRHFGRPRLDTANHVWKAAINCVTSAYPYNVEKFTSRRILNGIMDLMEQERFDVVQAESVYAAWYALRLRTRFPLPLYVLRSHNVEQVLFERAAESVSSPVLRVYLRLQARKMRRYENNIISSFDLVIPVTEVDRVELERRTGRHTGWRVIPAGVDTDRVRPVQITDGASDIAFAGPLRWLPNLLGVKWFLNEVWPYVKRDVPLARFKLMGEPPAVGTSLGRVPEGVDILGYVPSVEEQLATCRVFVVPLQAGSGIRLKILNAAAWGIPVVSTSIGAEGLNFRDGLEIMIRNDPEEFAAAVEQLLTDEELWTRMREDALARVHADYSWSMIAGRLLGYYKEAKQAKDETELTADEVRTA